MVAKICSRDNSPTRLSYSYDRAAAGPRSPFFLSPLVARSRQHGARAIYRLPAFEQPFFPLRRL